VARISREIFKGEYRYGLNSARIGLGAVEKRRRCRYLGLNVSHPCDKSVPTSRQGLDVAWRLGRITQGFAKARNGVVKAMVEIDKGVGRPDFYPKLFAGHEIAGTLQQRRKHTQGLALQAQLYTAFPELTGAQIQLKMSKRSTRAGTGSDMSNSPNLAEPNTQFPVPGSVRVAP
jgi:hypothetical protein